MELAESNLPNFEKSSIYKSFVGIVIFIFIVSSMTLFGKNQLLAVGIFLCLIYFFLLLFNKKIHLPRELTIYAIWMVWNLIVYLANIHEISVEAMTDTLLILFQIIIMSYAISEMTIYRKSIEINLFSILIGAILLILISNFISGEILYSPNYQKIRFSGITSNSNAFAFYLFFAFSSVLYFLSKKANRCLIPLWILLLLFLGYGIILSGSRKAFFALNLLIITWFWLTYQKYIIKKFKYIVIFAVIAVSLIFVFDFIISNTLIGKRISELHNYHNLKRVKLYKEGINLILENPVFGIGLGNFFHRSIYHTESHSEFIEVAVSSGIPGFFLYISIYIVLWLRLNRIKNIFIHDTKIISEINIIKSTIVTILFLATGRPMFDSIICWVYFSSVIGYTYQLEKNAY